jgi:hypothetical protein
MAAPPAPPLSRRRRRIGSAVLALALGVAFSASPARAETTGQGCTLHVTGAKPRPFKPSIFVKVKGPLPNPDDPSTKAYQYNPVTRAMALGDAELRKLFPAAADLDIVRHPQGMMKAELNAARGPLFPRQKPCHAELIVSDVVGVFPSTAPRGHPYGMVGELLAGGDRIELIFTLRLFDPGKDRPLKISSREDGSLPYDPAASRVALAGAVTAATSKAFADFAETVARRRAR